MITDTQTHVSAYTFNEDDHKQCGLWLPQKQQTAPKKHIRPTHPNFYKNVYIYNFFQNKNPLLLMNSLTP